MGSRCIRMAKKKVIKKATKKSAKKSKLRESKIFEIPNYAQTYEFTSSAASAMMVLKYLNKKTKLDEMLESEIWNEAVNGSVMHGSRYGIAYALAKRGAKVQIISNAKNEGYEKKLAVYEGINLDTLSASFKEIKEKANKLKIKEQYGTTTVNLIKKQINGGKIPIVLVNVSVLNPDRDVAPLPHWVVVKGYDKDSLYVNDPFSDTTITIEPQVFKEALGFDKEYHMITVNSKK